MKNLMLFFTQSQQNYDTFFEQFVKDEKLDLSVKTIQASISEEVLRHLPTFLKKHPEITNLNLQDQGSFQLDLNYDYIALRIAHLPHLKIVNLTNFSIGDEVVSSFAKHPNIQKLGLSLNLRLTDQTIQTIQDLPQTSQLKTIQLDACNLSQKKIAPLKLNMNTRGISIESSVSARSLDNSREAFETLTQEWINRLLTGTAKSTFIKAIGSEKLAQLISENKLSEQEGVISFSTSLDNPSKITLSLELTALTLKKIEMVKVINQGMDYLLNAATLTTVFALSEYMQFPRWATTLGVAFYYGHPALYRGLVQCSEWMNPSCESSEEQYGLSSRMV